MHFLSVSFLDPITNDFRRHGQLKNRCSFSEVQQQPHKLLSLYYIHSINTILHPAEKVNTYILSDSYGQAQFLS